jgi:hypothetical protein
MVIIKHVILNVMNSINHTVDGFVGLQDCMDILKSEPGPYTGMCQCDDGNQVVSIKVEGITNIKVEEDPGPAILAGIKVEHAVSLYVSRALCMGPTVYELNVESDVNIKFHYFLDMLYYYCDTAYLVKIVYLTITHKKNGLLKEIETQVIRWNF